MRLEQVAPGRVPDLADHLGRSDDVDEQKGGQDAVCPGGGRGAGHELLDGVKDGLAVPDEREHDLAVEFQIPAAWYLAGDVADRGGGHQADVFTVVHQGRAADHRQDCGPSPVTW
jgi:hypothetical protein